MTDPHIDPPGRNITPVEWAALVAWSDAHQPLPLPQPVFAKAGYRTKDGE